MQKGSSEQINIFGRNRNIAHHAQMWPHFSSLLHWYVAEETIYLSSVIIFCFYRIMLLIRLDSNSVFIMPFIFTWWCKTGHANSGFLQLRCTWYPSVAYAGLGFDGIYLTHHSLFMQNRLNKFLSIRNFLNDASCTRKDLENFDTKLIYMSICKKWNDLKLS